MTGADHVLINPRASERERTAGRAAGPLELTHASVLLTVESDLGSLERDWRRFEQYADCTAFQSFDWLSAWQTHVGAPSGVTPAIVVGRRERAGDPLFILPLATARAGLVRRLTFLGRDLCDYNAPLLAPDFADAGIDLPDLWKAVRGLLQRDQRFRHDVILLDKMPETVGSQPNPLRALPVRHNPSGAYRTALADDWETFYAQKRSSGMRKRDRAKRRKLAELGEVELVTPVTADDIAGTVEILIEQKRRALARMGVADIFSRPGYQDFFLTVATRSVERGFVHVSRLQVGSATAATNLGINFRGVYYHVLTSYDAGSELSRFGPGGVHLLDLMRYALEQGCTAFDFTIGDEPYKRDWSDTEMALYDYVAAATARGVLIATTLDAWRSVKRQIKQSRFWPALLRLRAKVSGRS